MTNYEFPTLHSLQSSYSLRWFTKLPMHRKSHLRLISFIADDTISSMPILILATQIKNIAQIEIEAIAGNLQQINLWEINDWSEASYCQSIASPPRAISLTSTALVAHQHTNNVTSIIKIISSALYVAPFYWAYGSIRDEIKYRINCDTLRYPLAERNILN